MIAGLKSFCQLNQQLMVVRGDTLLCLTKDQAVAQSNINLEFKQVKNRLSASLAREDALIKLWKETENLLGYEKEMSVTINEQLTLCTDQLDKTVEVMTADKRKTVIRVGLVALSVGVIVGILIK